MMPARWKRRALILACWMLYSLYFAAHNYLIKLYEGTPVSWWRTLALWLAGGLIWATLTPFIIVLARRFPITRTTRIRAVAIHLCWAIFFSFLVCALFISVYSLLFAKDSPANFEYVRHFTSVLVDDSQYQFLKYWVIVGLIHTLDYYRKYQERELRASQLETRLVQSQLDALRMQLNPHFLFNTLNSISVLMRRDVDAADRMLLQLSGLLRQALSRNEAHEIPLRQEIEFLERYLEIEQIRFRDRLTVRMQIDPVTLNALVPQLVFQPLVENAIRHGITDRETDGLIEIHAERSKGNVLLRVRDNGPGMPEPVEAGADSGEGIGLANTRARLSHLYGGRSVFDIRNAEGGGLVVTALLPFRTQAAENNEP